MCSNPCKVLSDFKGVWNQEPLLIGHTKILRRWRINLIIIILFPAIILLLESYYLHMTEHVSFNPEDEVLNESCYLSHFGCCEIIDYCWDNGVKMLQPQHHYYLNLPKEDLEGSNCPSFFPDLVEEYIKTKGWATRGGSAFHGRCRINPQCSITPTGNNATYETSSWRGIRIPIWKENEEGSNCPDMNTLDFVSPFNINRYYEYYNLNWTEYILYGLAIIWLMSLVDNSYIYQHRYNYKIVVTEP